MESYTNGSTLESKKQNCGIMASGVVELPAIRGIDYSGTRCGIMEISCNMVPGITLDCY